MINYTTRLYANNQELDLFQDEVVQISNNVTGLFDIDKLPSDFSREINIPGTKTNNAFFEHFYDIDITAPFLFTQDQKVECYLDISGYILVNGYLQLNKVNVVKNQIQSYDISLYGSVSNLSRDLRTTLLTDLGDLSIYNHTSSLANIANSWDGNLFSGDIVYPLIDYGRGYSYQQALPPNAYGIDTENGLLNIKDFKPAIRTKKVFDTIFSQLGYTYTSSFFNDPMWDNIYTLCDRGKQYPIYEGIDLETYGEFKICQTSGSTTDLVLGDSFASRVDLNFNTTLEDPSSVVQTPGQFVLPVNTTIQGKVKLNVHITGSDVTAEWGELALLITDLSGNYTNNSGSLIFLTEINNYLDGVYSQLEKTGDRSYTLEQNFTTGNDLVFAGSKKFQMYYNPKGSTTQTITIGKDGNTESFLEVTSLRDAADSLVMNIPINMPYSTNGVTCLDFVKGLQKKYNLVIQPSKTKTNHFEIETFNTWYKQGSVLDITPFVDDSKKFTVTPANVLAVNELEFTDTKGDDYLARLFTEQNNRDYGASYYKDDQNQFSEGKLEVQTTFGVSPLRYIQGSGTETGSAAPAVGYAHSVIYSNNPTVLCQGTGGTYTTLYTNSASTPGVGDVLYTNQALTIPFIGYDYIDNLSDPDLQEVESSTGEITGTYTCFRP